MGERKTLILKNTVNMFFYRGVEWRKDTGKFRAHIYTETGIRKWLGSFETAEDAARAYDEAAREVYGDETYLNFPYEDKDEKKVEHIGDRNHKDFCPAGHNLKKHGKYNEKRDSFLCRICNKEAVKRLREKKLSLLKPIA